MIAAKGPWERRVFGPDVRINLLVHGRVVMRKESISSYDDYNEQLLDRLVDKPTHFNLYASFIKSDLLLFHLQLH